MSGTETALAVLGVIGTVASIIGVMVGYRIIGPGGLTKYLRRASRWSCSNDTTTTPSSDCARLPNHRLPRYTDSA